MGGGGKRGYKSILSIGHGQVHNDLHSGSSHLNALMLSTRNGIISSYIQDKYDYDKY